MGNTYTTPPPFKPECFDDPVGSMPIYIVLSGATLHYLIVLIFIYARTDFIGGVVKHLCASIILICAFIQLVLDWILVGRYHAFENKYANEQWSRLNCQIYIFSTSPNAIHLIALLFCLWASSFIHGNRLYLLDDHLLGSIALTVLISADVLGGGFCSASLGFITHAFVGSFVYIWYFLMFLIVAGLFCFCCSSYVAHTNKYQRIASDEHDEEQGVGFGDTDHEEEDRDSQPPTLCRVVVTHAFTLVILWCFLLYYIVVTYSMVNLYNGDEYIDAWLAIFTDREYQEYLQLIEGNWEKQFSFYFMLL